MDSKIQRRGWIRKYGWNFIMEAKLPLRKSSRLKQCKGFEGEQRCDRTDVLTRRISSRAAMPKGAERHDRSNHAEMYKSATWRERDECRFGRKDSKNFEHRISALPRSSRAAAVKRLFSSVTVSESQASLRSLRVIRRLMPMGGFAPIYESGLGGICRPPSVPVGRAVLG